MKVRTGRKILALVASASVSATCMVIAMPEVALAAAPVFTAWPGARTPTPSGELIPARLYMTTPGFSIPNEVAGLFTGIPVDGTMEFTGPDAIAGVNRDIQVSYDPHPACNPMPDNDPDPPDTNYVVTDCPRVQLSLNTADSEGGIRFGQPLTTIVEPGGDRYLHPGGAVIESLASPTGPNFSISFNGTEAAVNDALADLVYEVGPDYRYQRYGAAGVTLNVLVGLNAENVTGSIQIRVLDVNGFPTHDGPTATQQADAQLEFRMPDMAGDPPMFTIADADNDEDVDDADDDPGLTTPPCPADDPAFDPEDDGPCSDPNDGPNSKMLLVAFMECGQPIANDTGFHFASSTFQYDSLSLDDFLTDFIAGTPANTPEVIAFRDALKTVLDAIDPGIWTFPLASVQPTDYTDVFVGFSTFSEIQDALSQVFFKHNAENDTCELTTVVSDLGNNGLPVKFVVTDENIPFGWEAPMVGLDVHVTTITTGELQEIEVGFDVPAITLIEGDPGDPGDPATAVAGLTVSPTPHPEFTVQWEARPKSGDTVLPGQATPNDDFSGTSNNNPVIPADDTSITAASHPALSLPDQTIFRDDDDEGNEVFTYNLELDANPAPPGYQIVPGANPIVVVTIIDDDDASASTTTFADVSRSEGDTGTANMTFTIGLDKPADGNESVDVTLVDGSATNPADYGNPTPTTVTFAALATSATFTVPIVGDLADEGGHIFTAQLSNAVNLTLADVEATGTIIDDDVPRALTIGDVSQNEDNSGTTTFNFTVDLDSPAKGGEQFTWATEPTDPAQATAPSDYTTAGPTVVTLAPAQTSVTLAVTVNGDATPEPNEQFLVQLSDLSVGLSLADGTAIGTIQNDDGVPSASINDRTVTEGHAGTTTVQFTVTLSDQALGGEQVTVMTVDGSATTADADYGAVTQVVTFVAGETSRTVDVTVNGDTKAEVDEAFNVSLSSASGLTIGDGTGTGTITNDDITISIAPSASVNEGASGAIAVTIEPATHPAFDVTVSAADVTSEAGDFAAVATPLAVPADAVSANIPLTANQDADTADETFDVTIAPPGSPPAGFVVRVAAGAGTGTVTITDDDVPTVVSIADATLSETAASNPIAISRSNTLRACEVAVTSINGSAVAPDDFVAFVGGTFTVNGSDLLASIVNDNLIEGDQTFTVTIALTGALVNSACQIGDGEATITITSEDVANTVSIADATLTEGAASNPVVISRSNTLHTCEVAVTSTDGTAVEPDDFAAFLGGSFTVNGGNLLVSVVNDDEIESDETFTITIALTPGADPRCQIGDGSALVTIVSEDVANIVSIADATLTEGAASNPVVISRSSTLHTCEVAVTSANGTAVAPDDFAAFVGGSFTVNGSDLSVSVVNDSDPEGSESFTITIALTPGADPRCQVGDGSALIVIAASDGGVNTPPSVTINQAAAQDDPTTTGPVLFTVQFSKPVVGFDASDVNLTGSTDANLTPSISGGPQTFTVSVAAVGATTTGTVVATIPAGAASDGTDGNTVSTSTDNSVTLLVDVLSPTVQVNQAALQDDPTNESPIDFTVTFDEAVTGFTAADLSFVGSTAPGTLAGTITGSGPSYSVAVSGMSGSGLVVLSVPAGVVTDLAGNPNTASTSTDNQVQYDATAPTVQVNQAALQDDPTNESPIDFTVTFDEAVTGFTAADLSFAGSTAPGTLAGSITGSGPSYSVAVSGVSGSGLVVLSVPAGVVTDLAGNPNTASTSTDNSVTYVVLPGPLTLNLPSAISKNNDPGQAGAVVTYPAVTASGGVPPIVVSCDKASGSFFPLGATTVSCTATDSEGGLDEEIVSGTFTVTVIDTEAPTISDNADIVRTTTGTTGVAVTFTLPTASDNSGVAPIVTCSRASGSTFPIGTTTVTCTATDGAGNSASSGFTVTVSSSGGLPPGGGLPPTGGSPGGIVALAALLVAAGLVLTRRFRTVE